MRYMKVSDEELSALRGLPYIQQLLYLTAIKPYVDYRTGIVGIARGISYQSLAEELYIEPHQGIKSGSPSKDQIRRAIKGLEKAGLLRIQSMDWKLVFQCLLIPSSSSDLNKPATKQHDDLATENNHESHIKQGLQDDLSIKPTMNQNIKAAIPHKDNNYFVCLLQQFEKFWESYPQPQNKAHAWNAFQKLNPDEVLFARILIALNAQIKHYQELQAAGLWVPHWRYPANWLAQRGWEDDINTNKLQEKPNAAHKARTTKQPIDFFWESCKGGADYIPDSETIADDSSQSSGNVIQFGKHRKTSEAC